MAKKDKTDISQEINEFQKFLFTPQDNLANNKEYKARMFGKHHDNFLINDFIDTSSFSSPYNFRTRLLQPEIRSRYNLKEIKAIEEALYLAANNPMLNREGFIKMGDNYPRKKSSLIHSRYISQNYDDIGNAYNEYYQGNIKKSDATKLINKSIRKNAAQDLAVIMRDTSNPEKFDDKPFGVSSNIIDAFAGKEDIYNILKDIDPKFADMPKEIFQTSGRGEIEGARKIKAENIVKMLASYGYNKEQIIDALSDTKYGKKDVYDIDYLNKLLGQRIATGTEEYTSKPIKYNIPPYYPEPVAGEPEETAVGSPGLTFYGAGEGLPMGYINPKGERVEMTDDFFDKQRLKELAKLGTPAIEAGGELVYQKPTYETVDDREFPYKLSPSVINYIKNNPEAAKYFNLEGMEAIDYSLPIYSIPRTEGPTSPSTNFSGGRTSYKSGGLTKLVQNKLNK